MEVIVQCLDELEDLVAGFVFWIGTLPRLLFLGGVAVYCAGLLYLRLG